MSETYEISLSSPKRNPFKAIRKASSLESIDDSVYERDVLKSWANHMLGRSSDSADTPDFSDGICLIQLVDKLTRRHNTLLQHTTPVLQCQRLDNYKSMLAFLRARTSVQLYPEMNAEGFLFGDVDMQYELVWQLVNSYKLCASERTVLSLVNRLVTQRRVRNFAADWADGIVLHSFVNSILRGNNPDCISPKDASPQDLLKMTLATASKAKSIPPILAPHVPINLYPSPKPLLTYLSLFIPLYISNVKRWLHNMLPLKKFSDFQSCWSDGHILSLLLDRVYPGMCRDIVMKYSHKQLPVSLQLNNVRELLTRAETYLNIKSNLDPNAIVNSSAEVLSIAIFLDDIRKYSLIKRPSRKLLAVQTSDYDTGSSDSSNTNSVIRTFSEMSMGYVPAPIQRRRSKSYDSLRRFSEISPAPESQENSFLFYSAASRPDLVSIPIHGETLFSRPAVERMSSLSIEARAGGSSHQFPAHMACSMGNYINGGTPINTKMDVGIREVSLEINQQSPVRLESNHTQSSQKRRGKSRYCIISVLILAILLLLLLIMAAGSVIVVCTVGGVCIPKHN